MKYIGVILIFILLINKESKGIHNTNEEFEYNWYHPSSLDFQFRDRFLGSFGDYYNHFDCSLIGCCYQKFPSYYCYNFLH